MRFDGPGAMLVTLLFLVTGCASPPSYDEYASSLRPVSQDKGRIYVYRLTSEGDAIRPAVRIDGEPVGRIIPDGFFFVDLPAGKYVISATTKSKPSMTVDLDAGEEVFVRMDVKILVAKWQVTPVHVHPPVAREELRRTEYTGAVVAANE